jgi:hypothetical protein
MPLIWYALEGATNDQLKRASDRIIQGNVRYWEVEELLGIRIPRELDHIDLIEPQPNAFAGLKLLAGRLHSHTLQDLPFEPDAILTHEQMDETALYNGTISNDTIDLFHALKDRLELREALGKQYLARTTASASCRNPTRRSAKPSSSARSKGHRPEGAEGEGARRRDLPVQSATLAQVRASGAGRGDAPPRRHRVRRQSERQGRPPALPAQPQGSHRRDRVRDGDWRAALDREGARVVADDERVLIDFDVASYYPAIIIGSGLYPKALGRTFLQVFDKIRLQRVAAKNAGDTTTAEGLKIA